MGIPCLNLTNNYEPRKVVIRVEPEGVFPVIC